MKMASLLIRSVHKTPIINISRGITLRKIRADTVKVCSARISSDVALTIADYVEQKREQARLGGGQRRIDNQHKKVRPSKYKLLYYEEMVLI